MTRIERIKLPSSEHGKDPNDRRHDTVALLRDIENARPKSAMDRLIALSTTNRLEELEANLQNDTYILNEMALRGQITLFYAKPNTGKTLLFLHFLIEAIKDGRTKGEHLFYINADDNYKGLFTKSKIADEFGFYMISPAEANISPKDVLALLDEIAQTEGVMDKIIVMDTLKKFTDMMSKRAQADLYEVLRRLVTKGATVIIAGHANKHKDIDGNLVYEGTSDTMNDIDCAYAIYRMSDPDAETQVVEFRREKDRGDVIAKVSYEYKKIQGMNYRDIIDSVRRLDDLKAERASRQMVERDLMKKYESEILFVRDLLTNGSMNQSEILKVHKDSKEPLAGEISVRSLKSALKNLTGVIWEVQRGEKNALFFSLTGAEAELYMRASRG